MKRSYAINLSGSVCLFIAGLTLVANMAFAGAVKERVTGIGGFFFRAENPAALSQWYLTHLGIDLTPESYDVPPWQQQQGPTVFSPFPKDTTYWPRDKQWMLNLRVANLDAMVKQLRDSGTQVDVDPETYPNGKFASLKDPEGNPLQLWEPAK